MMLSARALVPRLTALSMRYSYALSTATWRRAAAARPRASIVDSIGPKQRAAVTATAFPPAVFSSAWRTSHLFPDITAWQRISGAALIGLRGFAVTIAIVFGMEMPSDADNNRA